MKIRFANHRFEGERVIQTSPEMSNRISSEWYSRPNLYTGRALTADTLIANTKHHLRHMQLFGRHLSRGVIQGLSLSPYVRSYVDAEGVAQTEQWLRLTAGLGITNWGDDVTLPETSDIFLDHVSTWNSENMPRGAGIFVLQPLEILDEIVADPTNQCQWDEARDPFDDEQLVDGCRLVFVPWPGDLLGPIPKVQAKQFRNRLVYQIFDYEKGHPDTLFPWEYVGIPVGLAYITLSNGKISFIDQQAVVRKGGAPLSTKTMLAMNGTPFLWEARIQQFIGQLYDIRQTVDAIPAAGVFFDVLPPVGVLPKQALTFDTMRTDFFPSQFIIDAAPIPEEQLEVAMNASAGLAPFDLYQPEKIKLLVPVPQSVYQADLLKKEEPDPIFLETLRKLVREIRQWLSSRSYVREMADRVVGAVSVGDVPQFSEDIDTTPDEDKFLVQIERHTGLTEFGVLATDAVKNLHSWIRKNAPAVSGTVINILLPTADNPPKFREGFQGIENFLLELQHNIKKTEDLLNSGYGKAEADMYRLRQLLLGNVKSSRLATSSALGQIVAGQTRQPSIKDVESFFTAAQATKPGEVAVELDQVLDLEGQTEDEKLSQALTIMKKMEAGETLSTKDIYNATQVMTSAFSKRVGGDSKAISMVAQPTKVNFETADTYTFKQAETATVKKYRDSVELSRSVGLERSKPLVDRIYESPSMEVKGNAVKTKTSIFDALADVPFDIADEVNVVGTGKAILKDAEYNEILQTLGDEAGRSVLEGRTSKSGQWVVISTAPLSEQEEATLSDDQKKKVGNILAQSRNKQGLSLKEIKDLKGTENDLGRHIRDGLLDPDPDDGDEADYFTAGVSALEHGLNAMRVIEKILDDYKKSVIQSRKVLTNLRANVDRWHDKLGEIDDKLLVLRHDALVTRSLFEEERSRLAAINAQRKAILDNYVSTLVFVRPRLVDSRLDVPSVPLYAEYVNPVPACLAEDFEAVGELADMLDVFREMPVAWLTEAGGLVKMVTNTAGVIDLMKQAGTRTARTISAGSRTAIQTASYQAYSTNNYGKAISAVVAANQQYKQTLATQKGALDFVGLNAQSWLQLVDMAESRVSLADLIEKGRGFSKLASKATAIMENLEDVAVCLYQWCNELEPSIKLQWANLISIYDKPVDLRHLETLPSFDKIDFTVRRDLQNMVDWLFSQVDPSIDKARRTMNDLVRVCILLAGHAPVSTIVKGYVDRPSTGKVGDFLDVTVNLGQLKIGMIATVITQQTIAVQGIVADVGERSARIKVTEVAGGTTDFSVDKGSQVKFISGKTQKAQL